MIRNEFKGIDSANYPVGEQEIPQVLLCSSTTRPGLRNIPMQLCAEGVAEVTRRVRSRGQVVR